MSGKKQSRKKSGSKGKTKSKSKSAAGNKRKRGKDGNEASSRESANVTSTGRAINNIHVETPRETRTTAPMMDNRNLFATPNPTAMVNEAQGSCTRPVSSIELRHSTSVTPGTSLTDRTDQYQMLLARKNKLVQLEATIKSIVQLHLFPKLKFIQDPDREVRFVSSTSRKAATSIYGIVLNNCCLSSSEDEQVWWKTFGVKVTKKKLVALRNDKMKGIKCRFFGE